MPWKSKHTYWPVCHWRGDGEAGQEGGKLAAKAENLENLI